MEQSLTVDQQAGAVTKEELDIDKDIDPPLAIKELAWLKNAIDDAKYYRENDQIPLREAFDDVDDNDL